MALIWGHGPMTVSRLIPLIDGHLHFNTISTVVRELERMGYISHNGGVRPYQYYSKTDREEYISKLIDSIANRFFDGDKREFALTIVK